MFAYCYTYSPPSAIYCSLYSYYCSEICAPLWTPERLAYELLELEPTAPADYDICDYYETAPPPSR